MLGVAVRTTSTTSMAPKKIHECYVVVVLTGKELPYSGISVGKEKEGGKERHSIKTAQLKDDDEEGGGGEGAPTGFFWLRNIPVSSSILCVCQ